MNDLETTKEPILSSIEQLTKLQAELGYKEGELSTVAMLGLVGEAGEVLAEVDLRSDSSNVMDIKKYVTNISVPISGNLLHTTIKCCRDVETFKKAVRKGEFDVKCEPRDIDLLKSELADTYYYLNILATNVGLTVFDLAQMAHDKIRRKQAEGGSSEDRKS